MNVSMADRAGRLEETKYKILMVGDSGVGKSSIVHRYASNDFSPNFLPTIGIDYKMKKLCIEDKYGRRIVSLAIWDSAGQERFRNITKQYFRGAHGMCLVFDCTDRRSFENVHDWLEQIDQNIEYAETDTVIVLVGNKCDSAAAIVSDEEAQALADARGIRFFKTSAKANINVSDMFFTTALDMERRLLKRRASEPLDTKPSSSEAVHLASSHRANAYSPGSSANSTCCGGVSSGPISPMLHPSAPNLKM